jgi:hypothetical protein
MPTFPVSDNSPVMANFGFKDLFIAALLPNNPLEMNTYKNMEK